MGLSLTELDETGQVVVAGVCAHGADMRADLMSQLEFEGAENVRAYAHKTLTDELIKTPAHLLFLEADAGLSKTVGLLRAGAVSGELGHLGLIIVARDPSRALLREVGDIGADQFLRWPCMARDLRRAVSDALIKRAERVAASSGDDLLFLD